MYASYIQCFININVFYIIKYVIIIFFILFLIVNIVIENKCFVVKVRFITLFSKNFGVLTIESCGCISEAVTQGSRINTHIFTVMCIFVCIW